MKIKFLFVLALLGCTAIAQPIPPMSAYAMKFLTNRTASQARAYLGVLSTNGDVVVDDTVALRTAPNVFVGKSNYFSNPDKLVITRPYVAHNTYREGLIQIYQTNLWDHSIWDYVADMGVESTIQVQAPDAGIDLTSDSEGYHGSYITLRNMSERNKQATGYQIYLTQTNFPTWGSQLMFIPMGTNFYPMDAEWTDWRITMGTNVGSKGMSLGIRGVYPNIQFQDLNGNVARRIATLIYSADTLLLKTARDDHSFPVNAHSWDAYGTAKHMGVDTRLVFEQSSNTSGERRWQLDTESDGDVALTFDTDADVATPVLTLHRDAQAMTSLDLHNSYLTNVTGITLGGVTRTSWPTGGSGETNFEVLNVGTLNVTNVISSSVVSSNWAALTVNDDAYDATGWNGSTNVPTKNAIRDKIESLGSTGGSATNVFGIDIDSFSTNGTPTCIWTGTVATATSSRVQVQVTGAGPTNSASYNLDALFRRGSGNVAKTATNNVSTLESDAGMFAYLAEDTTDQAAKLWVGGMTNEQFHWNAKGWAWSLTNHAASAASDLVLEWHAENETVTSGTPAGFSAGDQTATLSTATISATQAQDGSNSLASQANSAYAEFAVSTDDIFSDEAGTVTMYIYVTSYVSGMKIFEPYGDASNNLLVRLQGSDAPGSRHVRMLVTHNGTSTSITTTGTGLSLNTWHLVTAKWRTGSTDPSCSVQIDAETAATSTTDLTSWGTAASRVRFGNQGTTGATCYIDNVKVFNTWQ